MALPKSSANAIGVTSAETDTSDEEYFSDASEGKRSRATSVPPSQILSTDDASDHVDENELENLEEEPQIAHAVPEMLASSTDAQSTNIEAHDLNHLEEEGQHATESDDETTGHSQIVADDDFDDFEEGGEADDFGTFDDGPQDHEPQPIMASSADISAPPLPLFDFDGLDTSEDIVAASDAYLKELFPSAYEVEDTANGELAEINPSFLTERSQSLWAQLVAPPPLQPPNWIRSRIRRLFLVSLGVPVDLDEILPASKQKKLVLPSIEIEGDGSVAQTEEPRANGAVQKLNTHNASAASLGSTPSRSERKKRGPAPPPDLDLNAARLKCTTTDAALKNFTVVELKEHVSTLEEYKHRAGKLLEYWLIKKDSATGDKEAFEEVIENLVKHAKKIRK